MYVFLFLRLGPRFIDRLEEVFTSMQPSLYFLFYEWRAETAEEKGELRVLWIGILWEYNKAVSSQKYSVFRMLLTR